MTDSTDKPKLKLKVKEPKAPKEKKERKKKVKEPVVEPTQAEILVKLNEGLKSLQEVLAEVTVERSKLPSDCEKIGQLVNAALADLQEEIEIIQEEIEFTNTDLDGIEI